MLPLSNNDNGSPFKLQNPLALATFTNMPPAHKRSISVDEGDQRTSGHSRPFIMQMELSSALIFYGIRGELRASARYEHIYGIRWAIDYMHRKKFRDKDLHFQTKIHDSSLLTTWFKSDVTVPINTIL